MRNLMSVTGTTATNPSLDDPIYQDTDVYTQENDLIDANGWIAVNSLFNDPP
jgi:hypothetical protein